ncbi:MAG: divergent polysaccharide deacetylase family protein [Rhodobacteraceae bacterium]|nr:divergent polysaccharide deacetylase family protein [Paracoccaceae bacterium]
MGRGFGAGVIWGGVIFVAGFLGLALLAPPDEAVPVAEQVAAPEVPAPPPETASPAADTSAQSPMPGAENAEAPAAPPAPAAPAAPAGEAPSASADPPTPPARAETPPPPAPAPADDPGPGDVAPEADAEAPAPQRPVARDPGAPQSGIGAGDAPPAQQPAPTQAAPPDAPRTDDDTPQVSAEADASPGRTAARPSPPPTSDATPPPSTPPPPPTETAIAGDAPAPDHADAMPDTQDGTQGTADAAAVADAPGPAAPAVRTDRLPRIGDALPEDARTEDAEAEDAEAEAPGTEAPDTEAAVADARLPAVLRHAAEVTLAPDRPRLAVILIDDGIDAETRADLVALPFPVTMALDPLAEGARDAAAAYRAAGLEVLMLAADLPARATASDLEVLFEGWLDALPEAVGLIDTPDTGFQNNRALAQLLVPVLERDGHALVSYARGLNAASQLAEAAGLARGQVFRVLDADAESVFTIRRYLDRAVFEAGRDGSVIVLGHADRTDTLAGLMAWRMEGRADQVVLVPVSAALGGL